MAKTTKKKMSLPRMPSVRDEIRTTIGACDIASQQLRDDTVLLETERAVDALGDTVGSYGTIWLCGNGPGFCLAVDVAHKLSTQLNKSERPTRSGVLGLNQAISTTSYGKFGIEDAGAAELLVHARRDDCLWCFASDPSSKALLSVAIKARSDLKIPVVIFTNYPGTPLVRFADVKVRIQDADERDRSGYCVQWAHSFLANIVVNQLKRISRRTRT